uniref:Uncharacterized protein n=1 Tax=Anopheles minimus TaxID=112268 RepID=A0A182W813_9DIPT
MKTIVVLALFAACVAQIHCVSYSSCGKSVYYTEQHPQGYLEELYHNAYPYPYAGLNHRYGDCECAKCRPAIYTQLYRARNTYH